MRGAKQNIFQECVLLFATKQAGLGEMGRFACLKLNRVNKSYLETRTMKLTKGLKNVGKTTTETTAPASKANGGASGKAVTIEAKVDVGFGNALYLRGEGRGLSWSRGIPLTCVDSSTWKWSGEAADNVKFKLLLNDAVWCQGENFVAAPGERVQVSPAF
jgi:hypothetical protein